MKRYIAYAYPEKPENPSLQAMFLGTFDRASDVLALLNQNVKQQQLLRNAMLLTFFDNVRGHHLDVMVRGRGPIDGEDIRGQLEAIDPKPYEGQPILRWVLGSTMDHQSRTHMGLYVWSFHTLPELIHFVDEVYNTRDHDERQSFWDSRDRLVNDFGPDGISVTDTQTGRYMDVDFGGHGWFNDKRRLIDFDKHSKPIYKGPR